MAIEFNTEFYLQSKFNQLESEGLLEQFELTDVASLAQFFEDNGVDAREHYLAVGMAEGINPSAEFDTNAYLEAKLADLQNADKYGDEFADFTVQDVIEAFQASGLTALEHFNEFGEAEGLEATPVEEEASELTEALTTYQAAVAEERAFLEAATENDAVTGVDENSTSDAINDAIDTAVDTAATGIQTEITNYGGFKGYNFTTASDAVRAQIVTEFRAQLEKDVAATKATVEETSGLLSKANTLVSASDAYEAAVVQRASAETSFSAEAAKFDIANGANAGAPATGFGTPGDFNTFAVTDSTVELIKVEGSKLVVTADGEDFEGIDALLAVAQAEYQALLTEDNAETRLQTAITSVLKAENPDEIYGDAVTVSVGSANAEVYGATIGSQAYEATGDGVKTEADLAGEIVTALEADGYTASYDSDNSVVVIEGVTATDVTAATNSTASDVSFDVTGYYNNTGTVNNGEYNAAVLESGALQATDTEAYFANQTALNDFNKAVQDFQAIAQVQSDSADLAEATATALEAVEAFEVELNETGTATEANDLFVYAEEAITISGFGLQGEDQLYIGGDFTEQRLADDVTDTRLGDSATLEVFFQQEGNNAAIYVENEAFAGNATNASDLTKITLTGVSIDDLQFENGYVSVVEAA